MIILDIEASGVDTGKCGIWQIGAIELENPENYFFEEARIDDEDSVEEGALKVTGKTEEYLREGGKQSQKQLIINFIEWVKTCKLKIAVGQNIGWDLTFLQNKCFKYGIRKELGDVLGVKGFDLYVLAQLRHFKLKGEYRLKENGRGNFSLPSVIEFCGMEDSRMNLHGMEVVKDGTPHNALEDCRLEGECYSRLISGKNLFPEFSKFEIPRYLKKEVKENEK